MPKETGRTKLVRAAILELLSEKKDWNERQLRQACYGKLAENDADEKETQRLKDSIRRIVSQMQASGELALAKRETTRKKGDATEKGGEETANAATPSDAPAPSPEKEQEPRAALSEPDDAKTDDTALQKATSPAPERAKREERPTVRMPKAKQMNEFLSGALKEDVPEKGETLVERAVSFFGVSGEQVNGVRGLVIQCLKDWTANGSALFDKSVGYRKAPPAKTVETTETSAPAPVSSNQESTPEPKPAPLPQVAVKRVARPAKTEAKSRKTDGEAKRGISRLVMNENRFAEQINRAGGAFFTEFVARLFEAYYASHGVTVCGRYVVDGSDDKGVDVILQTVDELGLGDVVLLQAKTRSSGQVTLKELREFYGVMAAEKADHGLFVTTSTFTTDAVTFVRAHPDLAAVDKYKLFSFATRLGIGLIGEGGALTVDPALFG